MAKYFAIWLFVRIFVLCGCYYIKKICQGSAAQQEWGFQTVDKLLIT